MIAADGAPELPEDVFHKYVKQCGVLVRDHIPITVREWNKPHEATGISYVGDNAKEALFKKMMANFTLPTPEVYQDELDENEEDLEMILERKKKDLVKLVKAYTFRKMAQQFSNWKKRLHLDFIKKDKTPDFTGTYEKIKPCWAEFVEYKKSEEALAMSERNKKNAAKKIYHHTMGQAGYKGSLPKWKKLENDLIAKDIIPETFHWDQRTRSWFFGHGGTLDSEGKCIYNRRHEENPLPIDDLRDAINDATEGRFQPDRDNDELTRALKNKEHYGRTRTTPGSVAWKHGFPQEKKKYPDRSRQRRKDLQAAEAQSQADRWRNIEEELKRHRELAQRQQEQAQRQQEQIDRLSQQQGTTVSQQQMEAALLQGAASNRKSSVASTQLQGDDDDAPPMMHPVDDITEMTPCELHVKVVNITIKAAVGYVKPIGPEPTHHGRPVPRGYAVAGVDEVMNGFERVQLDHPEGEDGEVTELGDAKNLTIVWLKEHIVIPNWTPRPSTARSSHPPSPPPQDQSPAQRSSSYSPPRSPSPARASTPPRQPSPPTNSQGSRKRRRTTASPKRQLSPLPKVPNQNLPKLPYHFTPEETKEIAKGEYEAWKSKEKAPKEPDFPNTEEDKARALKMVKTLYQPEPRLSSDYDRSILKSHDEKVRSKKNSSASEKCGKTVNQLGEQKNQSIPPLKVYSNTKVGPSTGAGEQIDPEFIALYGQAAADAGMSIPEYLQTLELFPSSECEYKYRHGHPLVRPGEENNLPTKMRRVHNWYMEASKESNDWIVVGVRNEHYGHGEQLVLIQFEELFQLFQQKALDKSIISAYCL